MMPVRIYEVFTLLAECRMYAYIARQKCKIALGCAIYWPTVYTCLLLNAEIRFCSCKVVIGKCM